MQISLRPGRIMLALTVAVVAGQALAAAPPADDTSGQAASPQDLAWWRAAKFGLFLHWGPVSLKGTELSWSRGGERRGMPGIGPGAIPVEEYDTLYQRFDPVDFHPAEWVALAQEAGMRYLVFTTKHHDGFCMFDSRLTDYTIMHTPYGRDIVAELAGACHAANLPLGFYYSPPDWHHPDYLTENHSRYVQYLHGQLRELCTRYGDLSILWFDGLAGTADTWDSATLLPMIRSLQPHILINNRAGQPADFDTPEQVVGGYQEGRPWESCITIGTQWAWKPDDQIKSLKECIDTLVRCVGGCGNLLLNVGPMPNGQIEPRQADRLREIGAWLKQYGETIYATDGGPFRPGPWGASTRRGSSIYIHALAWPDPVLELPPIDRRIVSSRVVTGGTAEVRQTSEGIAVAVPEASRQALDTIVELALDGPAASLPSRATGGMMPPGTRATASNVYEQSPTYAAAKAIDDDPATRWATDAGTTSAWLVLEFPKPVAFAGIRIDEACGSRVQQYEIQVEDGPGWRTIYSGATIGPGWGAALEPVTAARLRLNIIRATEGPTINEILLRPVKG